MPLSLTPPRALTREAVAAGAAFLAQRHPQFATILRRHGPPPLWGRRPGFSTLVHIILEQQVSLAAARSMYRWLEEQLGEISPRTVHARGIRGLRALGLTRQKAAYIHGLAAAVQSARLDLSAVARAPDAHARQTLLALPGIGPWTVDIYFLMALRRPDVWPQGDLALAQALHRVFELRARPTTSQQIVLAAQWAPWRSVAARLLWQEYLGARRARDE